jgi:sugar/nucleoside kinase (ribokinase family)
MPNPIDILAIGDSCIDQFMKIEDGNADQGEKNGQPEICFFHGSKIPVESFDTSIAGNALNVAAGTNSLGLKTCLYTEIGDDQDAERIVTQLNSMGIITDFTVKNPGTLTDIHPIVIYGGERTIFIYHEKRNYKVREWGRPAWIYYSSIGKDFEEFQSSLVTYLNQNPSIGVIFNPGTYHLKEGVEKIKDILTATDILILNKEEAARLVGALSLEETHLQLQKLGPKLTVVTDGKAGSSAYDGKDLITSGVYEMEEAVADKTGAGDAYTSGFISAIFHQRTLKEAMFWGSINSSHVIRQVGATNGLCTKSEIESLLSIKTPSYSEKVM